MSRGGGTANDVGAIDCGCICAPTDTSESSRAEAGSSLDEYLSKRAGAATWSCEETLQWLEAQEQADAAKVAG